MPATQHPEVAANAIAEPHSRTRVIICPEEPRQSPDPVVARRPAVLIHSNKRLQKRGKRVHWHPSVVENEHKMKSRPKAPEVSARPHTPPTSTKKLETRVEATPSSEASGTTLPRPPTQSVSPRNSIWPTHVTKSGYPSSSASAPPRMTSRPRTSVPANTSSKRSPGPSTQRPTQRPTQRLTQRPAQMHNQMPTQRPTTATRVPPRVPDPPRTQQPPPTPRPTRLKTPELPDIGGSRFCFCHGNKKDPACVTKRPVHQKMDTQTEAAMAYMRQIRENNEKERYHRAGDK